MDTSSTGKDSVTSEMETNDSDEIVVDSSSPKREATEAIEVIEVIENSSMPSQQNSPSILVSEGIGASLKHDKQPTNSPHFHDSAKDKRRMYTQSHTPSYHTLRESDLRRQSSDPVNFKSQLETSTSSIQPYLPKQHSDPGSPRSLITDIEGESYFKVTCGSLEGRLIWQRFACPGINVRCIRLSGKYSELITPKELVLQAGKQTLKDWKRAIRINGQMLRKLMDNNELDYYRHDTTCSNTCKSNKTLSGIDSMGSSRDSSISSSLTAGSSFEEHIRSNAPMLGQTASFERSSSEDSADVDLPRTEEVVTPETVLSLQHFWKGISQSEMLDDVLKEVMARLQTIQQRTRSSPTINPDDAIVLTNIVNSLDLMPSVKATLASRQALLDDHTVQVSKTVQDLQQKLELAQREHEHMKCKKRTIERTLLMSAPIDKRRKTRLVKLPRQAAIDQQRPASFSPHAQLCNGQILAIGPDYASAAAEQMRHSWPHHHPSMINPLSTTIINNTRLPQNVYVAQAIPPVSHPASQLVTHCTISQANNIPHIESSSPGRQQEETPPVAYIRSNLATSCTIRSSPDHSTRSSSPMAQK